MLRRTFTQSLAASCLAAAGTLTAQELELESEDWGNLSLTFALDGEREEPKAFAVPAGFVGNDLGLILCKPR